MYLFIYCNLGIGDSRSLHSSNSKDSSGPLASETLDNKGSTCSRVRQALSELIVNFHFYALFKQGIVDENYTMNINQAFSIEKSSPFANILEAPLHARHRLSFIVNNDGCFAFLSQADYFLGCCFFLLLLYFLNYGLSIIPL